VKRVKQTWAYPNGIEAHTCDVVQMVHDSLPCSSTVVLKIVARLEGIHRLGEAIGQELRSSSMREKTTK
jgi:hypothetical protein